MNRWKVYATVIACMLFGWIGVEAHAEFNFAVTPTIPENQVDKSKTYFDLKNGAWCQTNRRNSVT